MALAVVAIVLGVGVPAFSNAAANGRMSSATNDLVASLRAARSAAVMRRLPVAFCPTPGGTGGCEAEGNVALGWTVYVDRDDDGIIDDGDDILQRHGALPADLREGVRTTAGRLAFTGAGSLRRAPGAPESDYNIQLCDGRGDVDTGGGVAAGRLVQLSALGRQSLVRGRAELQSGRNPLRGC